MDAWFEATGSYPDGYENVPTLYPWLTWIWEAYDTLDRCRGIGYNGPMYISITDIYSYTKLFSLDQDESELLMFMVQKLDAEFISAYYKGKTNA